MPLPDLHTLYDQKKLRHLHFTAEDDVWFGDIVEKGEDDGEFLVFAWNEEEETQFFRVQCEENDSTKNLLSSRAIRCFAIVESGGRDIAAFEPASSERVEVWFEYDTSSVAGYVAVMACLLVVAWFVA